MIIVIYLHCTGAGSKEPESETVIPQVLEENATKSDVQLHKDETYLPESSIWYKHAQEYPGIKFSNYYTKQEVDFRGGTIKVDEEYQAMQSHKDSQLSLLSRGALMALLRCLMMSICPFGQPYIFNKTTL